MPSHQSTYHCNAKFSQRTGQFIDLFINMGCSLSFPPEKCCLQPECLCTTNLNSNNMMYEKQYRRNKRFHCRRRKKTLELIRKISEKMATNELQRLGLLRNSFTPDLSYYMAKQPALIVQPDMLPQNIISFNSLAPLGRLTRQARSELIVRRLGFMFAINQEGQSPGLIGLTQVIHQLGQDVPTSVVLMRETDYEEVIETQLELDYPIHRDLINDDAECGTKPSHPNDHSPLSTFAQMFDLVIGVSCNFEELENRYYQDGVTDLITSISFVHNGVYIVGVELMTRSGQSFSEPVQDSMSSFEYVSRQTFRISDREGRDAIIGFRGGIDKRTGFICWIQPVFRKVSSSNQGGVYSLSPPSAYPAMDYGLRMAAT